jgi:hypothetical protein
MGASRWEVEVPLTSTIDEAFHRARDVVFEIGDYVCYSDKGEIASIEQAIAVQKADGTHSILDLRRIRPGEDLPDHVDAEKELLIAMGLAPGPPTIGCCYRVPNELLRRAFGTTTPTRSDFERGRETVISEIKRGLGCFVPLREGNSVNAIVFLGFTGD